LAVAHTDTASNTKARSETPTGRHSSLWGPLNSISYTPFIASGALMSLVREHGMGMTTFNIVELNLQIIFNFDIHCRPRVTDTTIAASMLCIKR